MSKTPHDEVEAAAGANVLGNDSADYQEFWRNLLIAIGTEPREVKSLRGASGMSHDVVAVGIDDATRRLVAISGAGDARSAALAQADLQAGFGSVRVLLARPVILNLSQMAASLHDLAGRSKVSIADLGAMPKDADLVREAMLPIIEPLMKLGSRWMQTAQGVGGIGLAAGIVQLLDQLKGIRIGDVGAGLEVDFSDLIGGSGIRTDQELGICPVPLYDFSGEELEVVNMGLSSDDVVRVLRTREIYQFFFPPADQLALGLVDRSTAVPSMLLEAIQSAPELGHPFGQNEIVSATEKLTDIIDALMDRKLLVQGEMNLKVTSDGAAARARVQFTPRESVVSKILNRINVNLDISNWFRS